MSSAQHILQGLGYSNPSYEDLDKNDLRYCANLNEYTYNWAIERAKAYKEEFNNTSFNTNAITDRFERFGTKMIFGNDSVAGGGPGWLWY